MVDQSDQSALGEGAEPHDGRSSAPWAMHDLHNNADDASSSTRHPKGRRRAIRSRLSFPDAAAKRRGIVGRRHARDLHVLRTSRFRRRVRPIAVLPTLCTLGNLVAGFAAIHFASRPGFAADEGLLAGVSSLTVAGVLIFIGMFFDGIDGFVARLTRSTSELGAQLDSLADLVTFGVAPAYMSLQMLAKSYYASDSIAIISPAHDDIFAKFFWAAAAFYVCCTALRLARFNVEVPPSAPVEKHLMFRGLPSPGAAGCIASLILVHQEWLVSLTEQWVARVTGFGMAFILPLCAVAMVSGLGYVHVVNRYIRGSVPFHAAVRLAVLVVLGVFFLNEMLAIGFTAYALSAPVRTLYRRWCRPRAQPTDPSAPS